MKESFQDPNGQLSMMRIMSFVIVSMIMTGWCIVSITQKKLVELDPSLMGMIATAMGWKAVQKFGEKKDETKKL